MKIQNRRLTLALFGRVREEPTREVRRFGYSRVMVTWRDSAGKVVLADQMTRHEAIEFRERLTVAIDRTTKDRGGK